jgi:hypothetical protein
MEVHKTVKRAVYIRASRQATSYHNQVALNRVISIGARNKDEGNGTQRSTACIKHVKHNEPNKYTHTRVRARKADIW